MANYNRVVLIGNLTKDIELRRTQSGADVADFNLAINERRRDNNGNTIEEVTFVGVTVWGKTAVFASEYGRKGAQVFVEGKLRQEQWEQEGQRKSKTKVVCERLLLLGSRSDGQRQTNGGGYEKENRGGFGRYDRDDEYEF